MTNREVISLVRKKIQEEDADSSYYNSFIYSVLLTHAEWIIKREDSSNRIFKSNDLFKTLGCIQIIPLPVSDKCCPITTCCKIYRTKSKLPDIWNGSSGPIIKLVSSIDYSTQFDLTTSLDFNLNRNNPYLKNSKNSYSLYAEGYLYFTENPKRVNVQAFFKEDISKLNECDKYKNIKKLEDKCKGFLDEEFLVPRWTIAEIVSKTVEEILGQPKRVPTDEEINKNEQR